MSVEIRAAMPWLSLIGMKDWKDMTDEELVEVLKHVGDFDKYAFPTGFHKKFPDLPKADCADTKAYLKESPWMKKAYAPYVGGGILEIEAKPGGLRPLLPAPEVPQIVLQENSFSDKPTNQTESSDRPSSPGLKVCSITTIETKSQE